MELQRIEYKGLTQISCKAVGEKYQRVFTDRSRLENVKPQHTALLSTTLTAIAITVCFGILGGIAVLIGLPNIGWLVFNTSIVLFFVSVFAGAHILWRDSQCEDAYTKAQSIVDNDYQRACYRVSIASLNAEHTAQRWNTYVDRVELGTIDRFNDDVAIREDIASKLEHVLTMDSLVYQLLLDHDRICHEIEQGPTKNSAENSKRFKDVVALFERTRRLDFTLIDNMQTWHDELVNTHEALAL